MVLNGGRPNGNQHANTPDCQVAPSDYIVPIAFSLMWNASGDGKLSCFLVTEFKSLVVY